MTPNIPDNGFRGSAYEYDKLEAVAKTADKLLEQENEINETNWRKITHEIDPELTGKDMLESAEGFRDPEERMTLRRYIEKYRAEISQAVKLAIESGKIDAIEASARIEEIFNRPLIPEDQEIPI